MAIPSAQMAKDEGNLRNWSFYSDYNNNKQRRKLIDAAKIVYLGVAPLPNASLPQPEDLVVLYTKALLSTTTFKALVARKPFIRTTSYDVCAETLARYVLQKHWAEITS